MDQRKSTVCPHLTRIVCAGSSLSIGQARSRIGGIPPGCMTNWIKDSRVAIVCGRKDEEYDDSVFLRSVACFIGVGHEIYACSGVGANGFTAKSDTIMA